ncbi:MAG: hypothetical protein V3R95_00620 [Dehalococcoidia bacterium]
MALRAGGTVELIQQLKANYRQAEITEAEMTMLEFAELLTVQSSNVVEEDVTRLRRVGWADEDIVDIVHQTALFNYMTRVADGLGIENDDYMADVEERDRGAVDTSTWGRQQQR